MPPRPRVLCRFAAVIAAALIFYGSIPTMGMADGEVHHHMRSKHTRHLTDHVYGWGWDSVYGYYVGPIYGRGRNGRFRCFEPGYGWHPCPRYWVVPERRHWW
jgi:hypothetical protein